MIKKWSRHYNWQFMRLNPEYRADFRKLALRAVRASKSVTKVNLKNGVIDLRYYEDGSKEFGHLEDAEFNFCKKWRLSIPVSPDSITLPKNTRFRTNNLNIRTIKVKRLASFDIKKLFYRESLSSNYHDKDYELLLVLLRKGSSLKEDLLEIEQAANKLKPHRTEEKNPIKTDRADLDRMIQAYQLRQQGMSIRKIAGEMRSSFGGTGRAIDSFKGSILHAIETAEKYSELAPDLVFIPKK